MKGEKGKEEGRKLARRREGAELSLVQGQTLAPIVAFYLTPDS